MKLVVFGANGPVGKLLTQRALDLGHEVTAVTRRPTQFPLEHARLVVRSGDVLAADDVASAIAGQDAVLSVLGVPFTRRPVTVYSRGITHILAAMQRSGVRRLVAVTSGGTRPGFHREEGLIFGLVIKPILGRTLYADQRRMEALVLASDCDFTIVRPARLVDSPAVTAYRTAEAHLVPGISTTSRLDLAAFMLDEVASPRFVGRAVAIGSAREAIRAALVAAENAA